MPRSKGTQVPTISILIEEKGNGGLTLILAISALNFLVDALLNFSFQYPRALRFIKIRHFQDLSRIHPTIALPSHYRHTYVLDITCRFVTLCTCTQRRVRRYR